jgi:hypothetical protein
MLESAHMTRKRNGVGSALKKGAVKNLHARYLAAKCRASWGSRQFRQRKYATPPETVMWRVAFELAEAPNKKEPRLCQARNVADKTGCGKADGSPC